jgi:hypothetical protein
MVISKITVSVFRFIPSTKPLMMMTVLYHREAGADGFTKYSHLQAQGNLGESEN